MDKALSFHNLLQIVNVKDDCPTKASKPYPKSLKTIVKKHAKKKKNWSKKNVGSKYKYSNFATALAAVLVEEHSG